MLFYWKYKRAMKLIKEMEEKGFGEVMINRLLISGGNLEAEFENKEFTRTLATWAKQCLDQYQAPNFLSMCFSDGTQKYELTIQKMGIDNLTPAEKMNEMKTEIAQLKENPKKKIVAAALKIHGLIFSLRKPYRHADIMRKVEKMGIVEKVRQEMQGFLDSDGRWQSRSAAKEIAKEAGQIPEKFKSVLTSEDLW